MAQEVPASDLPEEMSQAPSNEPASGQEVPAEDLPESEESQSQPSQAVPSEGMQQYIGAAEAAARGATFGLATPIETALGVPKEDIRAREAALDPTVKIGAEAAGAIGSMFVPGVGEGWLINATAKAAIPIAQEASALAKVGRLGLRGMMEMGLFASGDEVSDAFLDKGHDAAAVAGHIVSAGALGFLTGGLFGAGTEALQKVQSMKLGEYLDNVAIGLGAAAGGEERLAALKAMHEDFGQQVPKGIDHGVKLYNDIQQKAAGKLVDTAAGVASHAMGGGPAGDYLAFKLADKYLAPYADKFASKYAPVFAKKVAVPVMLQAIKIGEHSDIANVLGYANKSAKGFKLISNAIEDTLNIGGKEALHASEDDNDKLDKYIEKGGINQQIDEIKQQTPQQPQAFAEGGEVKPVETKGGLASLYPTQNQMLTTAKGRVANYLTQLRPQPPQKLLFDTEHKDHAKQNTYRNALSVANAPLSVLSHIKHGTVTPEHVQHIKTMYPELHDHLAKKLTEKMVKHQFDEEKKPSYRVRQGLSLFLGAPLDSTMTPAYIQAAQMTFTPAQAPQQQQAQKKDKKGTGSLSKFSKDYQTASQSRESKESKD